MLRNIRISVRLFILVAALVAAVLAGGTLGIQGMANGDAVLSSVYNDRVVPLRDLKQVADMYAVNIVDTSHKARDGAVGMADAVRNLDQAKSTIDRKWRDYLATEMVPEETRLIAEIEPAMARARGAISLRSAVPATSTATSPAARRCTTPFSAATGRVTDTSTSQPNSTPPAVASATSVTVAHLRTA